MTSDGGVMHWQAKLGMTLIAIGSIGLFAASQDYIANNEFTGITLLITALLGLFMLMLSVGVKNSSSHLSSTHQLVPEEMVEMVDKIIGKEEE